MQAFFHIRREQIRRLHTEHYTTLNNRRPHFHSHIEIVLIHKGSAEVSVNGIPSILQSGELMMLPSYATHQFSAPQDTVDCTVLFVPTFLCHDFMEAIAGKQAQDLIVRDPEAVRMAQIALEKLEEGDLNDIEQTGYLHVILGTLLRHLPFEECKTPGAADLPTRLLFYINEHFREDLTVVQIARAMSYSQNYVAESFRSRFQTGISHYINTVRLNNALTLMRENDRTITDCAMESGFSSLRTFYRVFSEELGCTPREYLKNE